MNKDIHAQLLSKAVRGHRGDILEGCAPSYLLAGGNWLLEGAVHPAGRAVF